VHGVTSCVREFFLHGCSYLIEFFQNFSNPKINEDEIQPLVEFIASIDPCLPVCFLAFRPNFALENHPRAMLTLMEKCVDIAERSGLKNASWSGHAGISGKLIDIDVEMEKRYRSKEAQRAGSHAQDAGCRTHPRTCSKCQANLECTFSSGSERAKAFKAGLP
jgi:pyruvate formate lyase activating enzyme